MDIFKFLKSARVGALSIEFYEEWAIFEASNGYFKRAKAVMESASLLNITGSKDKITEINSKIDQLEAKSKSTVDKENIYPTNTLKMRRKQISPGLKLRTDTARHEHTTPVEDDQPVQDIKVGLK
jgi:hypothetical protein